MVSAMLMSPQWTGHWIRNKTDTALLLVFKTCGVDWREVCRVEWCASLLQARLYWLSCSHQLCLVLITTSSDEKGGVPEITVPSEQGIQVDKAILQECF
jgi:hypothetical protein